MKSLTEQPAVLSVHLGQPGQYVIRVGDLKFRPLVIQITKLLEDAQSFILITPSDIKVFQVAEKREDGGEESTPPEEESVEEQQELPLSETPPAEPESRVVRRKRSAPIAGHDEACARCRGSGQIQIALDNGSASQTTCPICRGEGVMKRYGARR